MLYFICMCNVNENMNNNYYPTLDENFKEAVNLFEEDLSTDRIFELLKNGNILQKQIAALKIEALNSYEEALALAENLTGCDGKIREAVSLKINELSESPYLHQTKIYDRFADAIIDINGNICRNIIGAIDNLKSDEEFCAYFQVKLLSMTKELTDKVKDFDFQDGKYKVNKEVFKLYWCLETIYHLAEKLSMSDLKDILNQTKRIDEYTIREKTAKILSKNFNDKELDAIRQELKQDKNYYVRRF